MGVAIRNFQGTDRPFLFATWLRGAYYGNPHSAKQATQAEYDQHAKQIEAIIAAPGTEIRVACLSDEPDVILGYVVFSGLHLHWVLVKKPWRLMGIAAALLGPNLYQFKTYSGKTKVGESLAAKYLLRFSNL